MKVGKKLLSTLLAIMMIISSVSVCFGVLGADNTTEALMSQIETHYSSLIDLIKDAEKENLTDEEKAEAVKKIVSGSNDRWAVERDTAMSSWHWVTLAYAEAAKVVVKANSDVDTFADIYSAIYSKVEAELKNNGSTGRMPLDFYDDILQVFTFGETTGSAASTTSYANGGTLTLDIKAGFNILQYKAGGYETIPTDKKDLTLYKGALEVKKESKGNGLYGITADSIKFETIVQDPEAIANALADIKVLIPEFISYANGYTDEDGNNVIGWFATNFEEMSTEALSAKVFEIAESIQSFEDQIITAGISSAEEIWDNFVAPNLNTEKTWKEVQSWYTGEVLGYVAPAYADAYQATFEALLSRANGETAGIDLLQTYNEIKAEISKLEKVQAYNGTENVNYFNNIVAAFKAKDGFKGEAYYNNVLSRLTVLGHKLAEAYAQENYLDFVRQFKTILDTANTKRTLLTPDESAKLGHVWLKCEATPCTEVCEAEECTVKEAHCVHYDFLKAEAFVLEATETIAKFNTYVFPYITDATGTVVWSYLKNLDDNAYSSGALKDGEGISLEKSVNWDDFISQYNVFSLNVGGKEYIDAKVAMDAVVNGMSSAVLNTATYPVLKGAYEDLLLAGYDKCAAVAKDPATAELFQGIFGTEGMKPYDDFINNVKRLAANRIYDLSQRVVDYYNLSGGVTYYNFESIILAYNAISAEASPAALGVFLRKAPAYDPEAFEDGVVAHTLEEVEAVYESITEVRQGEPDTIINQANGYKKALETLRSKGGDDVSIRQWLFSEAGIAGAPNQGSGSGDPSDWAGRV